MREINPIVDKHGRVHDYLRISLTDRCNHRCFYCMPEEGIELTEKENLMSMEEVISLAKTFVHMGVKKIRLTGGEPLVRKNIAFLLRELGKLPIELAISTNGVLVDKYIDVFEEIGLKAINISLDTLVEEKNIFITKRDYFKRIMSNIDLLIERGFNVKINVVPIRGVNEDEILDFIEYTKDRKLSIRFIEFMPFQGNNWDWDKGISYAELMEMAKEKYGHKVFKIQDGKNDTTRNYKVEGYQGQFGVISSVTNPFCGTCNRIRITSDGRMKNCLFSNSETDLLSALRNQEELEPLIRDSILNKASERGGMDSFEKISNPELNSCNRTMIAIGG